MKSIWGRDLKDSGRAPDSFCLARWRLGSRLPSDPDIRLGSVTLIPLVNGTRSVQEGHQGLLLQGESHGFLPSPAGFHPGQGIQGFGVSGEDQGFLQKFNAT